MAKLNIGQVLANLAQTQAGMMAGKLAGEQEMHRRQMEQGDRVRQQHATMLSMLDKLDPAGQRTLLSGIFREQENLASGRPFDYGQAQPLPGDRSPFSAWQDAPAPATLSPGQPQAPSAAPPGEFAQFVQGLPLQTTPAPPAGVPMPSQPGAKLSPARLLQPPRPGGAGQVTPPHTERLAPPTLPHYEETPQAVAVAAKPKPTPAAARPAIPSRFGDLALRGVDPKEAQRVSDEIGRRWTQIQQTSFIKDPNTQAALRSYYQQKPTKPVSQWTEEDVAQAQRALQGMNDTAAFHTSTNARFQNEMDQAEVKQIERDLPKLSGYRADNLQQVLIGLGKRARGLVERGTAMVPSQLMAQLDDIDMMEQALAAGDKQQAGLILGLIKTELTPKPKDVDPYKALDTLLGQAPRWAGLDPKAQQVFIRRARQAAQEAGLDPSVIPDKLEAVMSDEARQRLGISRGQLDLAKKRETRLAGEQAWRRRFDERKEQQRQLKEKEGGNLTEADQKRVGRLEAARDAMYQRKNKILEMAPVDLKPGSENAATKGIGSIDREIERLNGEIETILRGAERRGKARGSGAAGGGLTPEGLAKTQPPGAPLSTDPSKPTKLGAPARKWAIGNEGRLQIKQRMYNRYRKEGYSEAEARKFAEEDAASQRPR